MWKGGEEQRRVQERLKNVLSTLKMEEKSLSHNIIVGRASFTTTNIRGSKVMSAFQLDSGFETSKLGINREVISQEILQSNIEREYARAVERIINSKKQNLVKKERLTKGTNILVYNKFS